MHRRARRELALGGRRASCDPAADEPRLVAATTEAPPDSVQPVEPFSKPLFGSDEVRPAVAATARTAARRAAAREQLPRRGRR